MSFNNVSQVVVAGPAINNVGRDQFNVTARVVHISSRADDQSTEYDEYERLKTGDIVLLKEIHRNDILSCGCWWENCGCNARRRVRETIYSVELVGRQSKCTAIAYEGQEAQEFWEENFRRFSKKRSPDTWQLYGLNRSRVPFLIFHDELVPLEHIKRSFWGNFSVRWLAKKLHCSYLKIWLKAEGTLIKGPYGPVFDVLDIDTSDKIPIPSSAEMLKDDVSFRFFQKFPSTMLDHQIVKFAQQHYTPLGDLKSFFCKEPHNILLESTPGTLEDLRFDTVYSLSLGAVARYRDGRVLWENQHSLSLVDGTVMDDGLICFKLCGSSFNALLSFDHAKFKESWLSQSSRIIDACRMWGTEEQFFTITPRAAFYFWDRHDWLPENQPPIYLFIYPPPMTWSGIKLWLQNRNHFWSLDGNGRSEMTEAECRQWGVPELKTWVEYDDSSMYTWPSHVYANIRNWQVARGFDPTTSDFAQSLGYPELDILIDNEAVGSWFEEVHSKNLFISDKQSNQRGLGIISSIPRTSLTTSTTEPLGITVPPNHSMVKAQPKADTSLCGRLLVPQQEHFYPVVKASHSRIPIPTWRAQGKSWRSVLEGGTVDSSHGQLGNSGKMPKLKIQTKSTRRRL